MEADQAQLSGPQGGFARGLVEASEVAHDLERIRASATSTWAPPVVPIKGKAEYRPTNPLCGEWRNRIAAIGT